MEVSCQEQIIHATKEVENALRSAALLSLKRKKNPRPSKHRNKKWFDNDLHNKRKQLLNYGKIFSHYPRDPLDRRRLTKFRLSAHKLLIETGRYKGIPRNERLCERCLLGEVEDECHFLFKCQKFDFQRTKLLEVIHKSCPNFPKLKLKDQLIWVLSSEDLSVLRAISEYIKTCE